jgi:hypothetical protein
MDIEGFTTRFATLGKKVEEECGIENGQYLILVLLFLSEGEDSLEEVSLEQVKKAYDLFRDEYNDWKSN